jgi:hypothetical protein
MKDILLFVVASIFVIALIFAFIGYLSYMIWFLPPVAMLFLTFRMGLRVRIILPATGIALILVPTWAKLLTMISEYIPSIVVSLLWIPYDFSEGNPSAGRYDPGPWTAEDFEAYLGLASLIGLFLTLYSMGIEISRLISKNSSIRVWSFRFVQILITVGGCFITWKMFPDYFDIYLFISYFLIWGVFASVDPKDLLNGKLD